MPNGSLVIDVHRQTPDPRFAPIRTALRADHTLLAGAKAHLDTIGVKIIDHHGLCERFHVTHSKICILARKLAGELF
jgi:hypothetical protein